MFTTKKAWSSWRRPWRPRHPAPCQRRHAIALVAAGLDVIDVAEYTGQPEIFGGRVKTLHPKIHGGILARRDHAEDIATLERQGFLPIDLVVVNLYPFEATVARPDATWELAIENIDIGGPALIRAAAKNHAHVAVLTSPGQYESLIAAINAAGGTTLAHRRAACSRRIPGHRSIRPRDRRLPGPLADEPAPDRAPWSPTPRSPFRPAATTSVWRESAPAGGALCRAGCRRPKPGDRHLRHGKELSYNNLLDLDNALRLVRQFADPAACILKHNNPCGAAIAADTGRAFERAYEGDPVSAFGGIVGLNRPVDLATAERMCQPGRFLEAVLAPGFDEDALEWLRTKPSWRNSVRLVDLRGAHRSERARTGGPRLSSHRGRLARSKLGPARGRSRLGPGPHAPGADRSRTE